MHDLKATKKDDGEFSLNIVISDTLVNNGKFTAARAYGKHILVMIFLFSNNSEFNEFSKIQLNNKLLLRTLQ